MLHQLANLPDNELMARARKLKDEEAAGILLERYSHLLATVSLPSLNSYGNTPEEFFPTLLQRLFYSLQTQTIPKIGEWMQFFVKSQGSRTARNTFYFPSSASSDITRLEYKAERADSNLLQKHQLTSTMNAAFYQLNTADRELLEEFYLEQKTFAEIVAENGYTIEEIRIRLKRCKQELASLTLANLDYTKFRKQEQDTDQGHTTSTKQAQEVPPGYSCYHEGDLDEAMARFTQLTTDTVSRYRELAHYQLAMCFKYKRQKAKARHILKELVSMNGRMKRRAQLALNNL